jgi:hypothetical protein
MQNNEAGTKDNEENNSYCFFHASETVDPYSSLPCNSGAKIRKNVFYGTLSVKRRRNAKIAKVP